VKADSDCYRKPSKGELCLDFDAFAFELSDDGSGREPEILDRTISIVSVSQ